MGCIVDPVHIEESLGAESPHNSRSSDDVGERTARVGRGAESHLAYYPKFCIGFKIRKSRSEQLLLSGSGHSK